MEKGGAASIDLKRDGKEDLTGRVHLLPCCVKHDGPTDVSHYFKPKPSGTTLSLPRFILTSFAFFQTLRILFFLQALEKRDYRCSKHILEAGYCKELLSSFLKATLVIAISLSFHNCLDI